MADLTKPRLNVQVPDLEEGAGSWQFEIEQLNPWAWREQVFTPDECDSIIHLAERKGLRRGRVSGRGDYQKDRLSDIRFLFPDDTTIWMFQRVTEEIMDLNQQFFGFDVTGLAEGIQFTRYTAPGENYDWHVDATYQQARRKLSFSVLLSDPDEYQGGDFQVMLGREPATLPRERGTMLAFPSYVVHRVTPVTEGTRYSLVAWITGPAFR